MALAAAAAFAVGAWLAAPLHRSKSARPWHVVLFDRSASVERTRPDHARWIGATLAAERRTAMAADAQFAALVFAGDRVWWQPPLRTARGGAAPPALGDPLSSDLAGALELVWWSVAREVGAGGGVVRVFSDGRATTAGAESPARDLARAGLRVELLEPGPAQLEDLALLSLRAPEQLEESAPLACELRVESTPVPARGPRKVRVQLELDAGGALRTHLVERTLAAGESAALWRFDLGPAPAGGARIAARVELPGDPVPENDRASRWVAVGGALPIAVLDAGQATSFRTDPERWPGLSFVPTALADLPGRLVEVHALISVDVDPLSLPLPLVADFVAAGGGWLHLAGASALRAADRPPQDSALARDLLPLWPAAPPRPQRDVLLLIDGSGSMAGDKFLAVQDTALRLAGVVPRHDRLWLAFFGSKLEPSVLLRGADVPSSAALDFSARFFERPPGGATDIQGSLAELARTRAGEPRELLALLLSDGRDPAATARPDLAPLRAQLAQSRIALRAFAFGADAEQEFLASLLPPGQSPTAVDDPKLLAEIVARTVDEERVRLRSSVVPSSPNEFPPGLLAAELAQALSGGAPPAIERSWIAEANSNSGLLQHAEGPELFASSASVLWRSAEGDPLLAMRELGLGYVAAMASTPASDWAPSLGEPAAIGPLLRAIARGDQARHASARASVEDGVLWVRDLAESTPARVRAVLPNGAEAELSPPSAARDQPLSTRCAPWPVAWGAPQACVLSLRSLLGLPLQNLALEVPGVREFAAPARELDTSGLPAAPPSLARAAHPAAPWVLAGALGLLTAALFLGLGRR